MEERVKDMKKSRMTFLIAELSLALLTVFFVYQIFRDEESQKRVAVIVESSGDEKWDAFINGLKQAAGHENIHLIICNTDEIENAEEEKRLITEQLRNDVDGFIIQAAPGYDVMDMLKSTVGDKPVLLVSNDVFVSDGDVYAKDAFPCIMPDNYEMGYQLGMELIKVNNNDISGKSVGIVGGFALTDSGQKRRRGFKDALAASGCNVGWEINTTYDSQIVSIVKNQASVDFIVALETETLEQLGELMLEPAYKKTQFYGIGNSQKCVCYLDRGMIQGLMMADGYEMGYNSIVEISKAFSKKFYVMQSSTTDIKILRKDDIYTPENEQFLQMYE